MVKKQITKDSDQYLSKFIKPPNLMLPEIRNMKQAFDIFDKDKSGGVSVSQMMQGIKALGMKQESKLILDVIRVFIQQSHQDQLNFEKFMIMLGICGQEDQNKKQKRIKNTFNQYDIDGKGYINYQDFRRVCQFLGQVLTQYEQQCVFKAADADKDGKISFEQYRIIMNSKYH